MRNNIHRGKQRAKHCRSLSYTGFGIKGEKEDPEQVISTTLKTKLMCEILSQRGGKEELETVIVRVLLQFLDYIWKGIKKKKTV